MSATVEKAEPRATSSKDAPLYPILLTFFRMCTGSFYASTEVSGQANVDSCKKHATVLCFNHGNGLVDSGVLIPSTPFMVRFCAKDSLWKVPFWGALIRASGAIPVFRPREHGAKASEYNESMYSDAVACLLRNNCLGIAPEGVSRFAPNMALPLKTGPVRIALQALQAAVERGEDHFEIRLLPVGLVYTHREKFRSDCLVNFAPPIVLTTSKHLPSIRETDVAKRDELIRETARKVTEELNVALQSVAMHSPDFQTSKIALTASRMFFPSGTRVTLKTHTDRLRAWVDVFVKNASEEKVVQLRSLLLEYQNFLDEKRIKDERLRRYEIRSSGEKYTRAPVPVLMLFRLIQSVLLWCLALPGLAVWSPFGVYIRFYAEPRLLAKGIGWVDSVTEMKLITGFIFMVLLNIAVFTLAGFNDFAKEWRLLSPVFVWMWFWFTIRVSEEAMASTRSLYSHFKFYFLYPETRARMLDLRKRVVVVLREVAATKLDPKVASATTTSDSDSIQRSRPWEVFHPMRRRKKDWNETLRPHDHHTGGDYF